MTISNESSSDDRPKVRVKLEFEDLEARSEHEIEAGDLDAILYAARSKLGFENAHVFERDNEETLASIDNRRAISILVHRRRRITVEVNYDGDTKSASSRRRSQSYASSVGGQQARFQPRRQRRGQGQPDAAGH